MALKPPQSTLRSADVALINGLPTVSLIDFSIMLPAWDSSLAIPCTQNILSPDLYMASFQLKGHLFGGRLCLRRVGLSYEGPMGGCSGASHGQCVMKGEEPAQQALG